MFRSYLMLAACACLSLAACGPTGGVASASAQPAPVAAAPPSASTVVLGAVADATLPPISSVSPTASTTIDDIAIGAAFEALDTAAYAADALLAAKPALAGTQAAKDLAGALEGTATWLSIASQAQKASQAQNYAAAIEQAKAALVGAQTALATLKGVRK